MKNHFLRSPLWEHRTLVRMCTSADKSYDRTFSMAGNLHSNSLSWQEPDGIKGPFTATLDLGLPFKADAKPITIRPVEQDDPGRSEN